jgi:hypothetical protein
MKNDSLSAEENLDEGTLMCVITHTFAHNVDELWHKHQHESALDIAFLMTDHTLGLPMVTHRGCELCISLCKMDYVIAMMSGYQQSTVREENDKVTLHTVYSDLPTEIMIMVGWMNPNWHPRPVASKIPGRQLGHYHNWETRRAPRLALQMGELSYTHRGHHQSSASRHAPIKST